MLLPFDYGEKQKNVIHWKIIKEDFNTLTKKQLTSPTIHLNEGKYHQGEAAVIQYIGQKWKKSFI